MPLQGEPDHRHLQHVKRRYSGNGGPLALVASLSDGYARFDNVNAINNAA
jgi:hypothetical protein